MTNLQEVLSKYTASVEAQETAKDRTIAKLRAENENLKHAVRELVKANLEHASRTPSE